MASTILEALKRVQERFTKGADWEDIHNAIVLLEKGYETDSLIELLIEASETGKVEDVPAKEIHDAMQASDPNHVFNRIHCMVRLDEMCVDCEGLIHRLLNNVEVYQCPGNGVPGGMPEHVIHPKSAFGVAVKKKASEHA